MQAWTASAYGCLPSPASLYGGPAAMFASKSSLHRLDGLHWALAGALGLVSAALGLYIMKGHSLQKQVTNSSTELSRLLLKVSADGFILTRAAFHQSSLACAVLHCWIVLSNLDKLHMICFSAQLMMQVINLQQSLQSPGRVPIVRHTSSMSAMTPFPLIHLL